MENERTVSNYTDKEFIAAGDVDKIKSQAIENVKSTYEKKLADQATLFSNKENDYKSKFDQMDSLNRKLLIESEFKSSDFIKEQTNVPWNFLYNTYGKNFHIEDIRKQSW